MKHAGWSSPVARQAHNLKVVGSNPTPATNYIAKAVSSEAAFCIIGIIATTDKARRALALSKACYTNLDH